MVKVSKRSILFGCLGVLAFAVAVAVVQRNRSGFDVKDPSYRFVGCGMATGSGEFYLGSPPLVEFNLWLLRHHFSAISPASKITTRAPEGATLLRVRYTRGSPSQNVATLVAEIRSLTNSIPLGTGSWKAVPNHPGFVDCSWSTHGNLHGAELRLYDPSYGHLVATCRLK